MPSLDLHPQNKLGQNILEPAIEAKLLADGMVFARRLTDATGHTFIFCGQRPLTEFATDMVRNAHKYRSCTPAVA